MNPTAASNPTEDDYRFTPEGVSYAAVKAHIRATYGESFYAVKMARSIRRGPCAFLRSEAARAVYPASANVVMGYGEAECQVWEERNGPAPVVADLPEA